MRAGIGYDIHRLTEGRKLILGGEEIPFVKGLLAHSDGDVLLHAICDALLGAAGRGDIGEHFPDTDPAYKNISSLILLGKVSELLKSLNMEIGNIDSTLIMEEPKIAPFKNRMKENISRALKVSKNNINIKATTAERSGDIGKGEAIAAYAIVLVKPKKG